jgi:hypothetical protein
VRGRTAHSIEKVARIHHRLFISYLPFLLQRAKEDEVYMVRFHLAMLFGYVEVEGEMKVEIINTLFSLLEDEIVFVKSWSVVSLTIIGLDDVQYRPIIMEKIRHLLDSNSIAVRRKVDNAIAVLEDKQPLPKGWFKKK